MASRLNNSLKKKIHLKIQCTNILPSARFGKYTVRGTGRLSSARIEFGRAGQLARRWGSEECQWKSSPVAFWSSSGLVTRSKSDLLQKHMTQMANVYIFGQVQFNLRKNTSVRSVMVWFDVMAPNRHIIANSIQNSLFPANWTGPILVLETWTSPLFLIIAFKTLTSSFLTKMTYWGAAGQINQGDLWSMSLLCALDSKTLSLTSVQDLESRDNHLSKLPWVKKKKSSRYGWLQIGMGYYSIIVKWSKDFLPLNSSTQSIQKLRDTSGHFRGTNDSFSK